MSSVRVAVRDVLLTSSDESRRNSDGGVDVRGIFFESHLWCRHSFAVGRALQIESR
jgi:hypothetical protein